MSLGPRRCAVALGELSGCESTPRCPRFKTCRAPELVMGHPLPPDLACMCLRTSADFTHPCMCNDGLRCVRRLRRTAYVAMGCLLSKLVSSFRIRSRSYPKRLTQATGLHRKTQFFCVFPTRSNGGAAASHGATTVFSCADGGAREDTLPVATRPLCDLRPALTPIAPTRVRPPLRRSSAHRPTRRASQGVAAP